MNETVPIDSRASEARRTATLVIRAMLDGDNRAAADLIKSYDDPRQAWIVTASICTAVMGQIEDPAGFLAAFGSEGLDEWIEGTTPTARARDLLRKQLEDGKRHSYPEIRALALREGIDRIALMNAARQLGVKSGNVNQPGHWYQLPKSRSGHNEVG